MTSIPERKRAAWAVRREADRAKAQRELRCFWTWPWGHLWRPGPAERSELCEVCYKYQYK